MKYYNLPPSSTRHYENSYFELSWKIVSIILSFMAAVTLLRDNDGLFNLNAIHFSGNRNRVIALLVKKSISLSLSLDNWLISHTFLMLWVSLYAL